MSSVDSDRPDGLFAVADRGPIESGRFARELRREYPALAAELRTLRERVAELSAGAVELTDGAKEYNDLIAERDRLRAERDAARDEAAGLREALEKLRSWAGCAIDDAEASERYKEATDALARTPDQHRARIVAAGLREAATELKSPAEDGIAIYERMKRSDDALLESGRQTREAEIKDWLLAEAERLEKGAGND